MPVGAGHTPLVFDCHFGLRRYAALDRIPYWPIALSARIFPAMVFWQSGQTKVAGFNLKPSAIALFENEYLPLIDALYDGSGSCFIETQVRFEDGRTGSVSADLKIVDAKTFSAAPAKRAA